ncbi:MAG: hypothetical protein EAZ81_10030 [Verrucomicrobia bacterium]|nr:MAG: hypothetical protein EAZ81_10030 [Verrucomicrobiota bacterium]
MRKYFPLRHEGGGNQIIDEIPSTDPAPRPHLGPRDTAAPRTLSLHHANQRDKKRHNRNSSHPRQKSRYGLESLVREQHAELYPKTEKWPAIRSFSQSKKWPAIRSFRSNRKMACHS